MQARVHSIYPTHVLCCFIVGNNNIGASAPTKKNDTHRENRTEREREWNKENNTQREREIVCCSSERPCGGERNSRSTLTITHAQVRRRRRRAPTAIVCGCWWRYSFFSIPTIETNNRRRIRINCPEEKKKSDTEPTSWSCDVVILFIILYSRLDYFIFYIRFLSIANNSIQF